MPKTHRVDEDVQEFCGWPELMRIIHSAKPGRDQALIAATFLTGGRISEVLLLKRGNFDLSNKEILIVKSMPVLKRFKKVGERIVDGKKKWITEKQLAYRTFPIVRKETAVPVLENWLKRFRHKDEQLFDVNRVKAFLIIRALGKDLYPHWFRAQRACQLAYDYGFDVHDLMDFFQWKDIRITMHYSSLGYKGLAKRMGVKV